MKNEQHSIVVTISKNLEPLASEYDGVSKWTSSIDIDCGHLESIFSVWNEATDVGTYCHY